MNWVAFVAGEVTIGLFLWWANAAFSDTPGWIRLAIAGFFALGVMPTLVWPLWQRIVLQIVKEIGNRLPIIVLFSPFVLGLIIQLHYDSTGEERRMQFWSLWTRPLFERENLQQRMIVRECEYQAQEVGNLSSPWKADPVRATHRFRWCLQVSGLDWERCVEGSESCHALGYNEHDPLQLMFLPIRRLGTGVPEWDLPVETKRQRLTEQLEE